MHKKERQIYKSNSGFTIVEILVVIAIIGSISAISFNIYIRLNHEKQIQNEMIEIYQMFKGAKKQSLNPNYDNCSNFTGYKVSIKKDNNSLKLEQCCGNNCTITKTYKIKNPAVVISKTSRDNITFLPMAQGTNNTLSLVLEHKALKLCRTLSISRTAVIEVSSDLVKCQ